MDKIPINFEHDGKEFNGHFQKVSGSGYTSTFHLMIDGYYRGQLFLTENYGWQLQNNKGEFGEYVVVGITS